MAFTTKLSIHWDAGKKFGVPHAGKMTDEIKRLVELGLTTIDVVVVDGEITEESALTITREFADVATATAYQTFVTNLAAEAGEPVPTMSIIPMV